MVKKLIKYALLAGLLVIVAFKSVYFKKLDEVKKEAVVSKFDAAKYAKNYYKKLQPRLDDAIDIKSLLVALKSDPGKAFSDYGHALGVGNIKYFLVNGSGVLKEVKESDVKLSLASKAPDTTVNMTTEFVYGNAIRDASGIIKLNEFTNTTDLNNVSAEINKIVRTEVLPPFKAQAAVGDSVKFTAALQLNEKFLNTKDIELIPVRLQVIKPQ